MGGFYPRSTTSLHGATASASNFSLFYSTRSRFASSAPTLFTLCSTHCPRFSSLRQCGRTRSGMRAALRERGNGFYVSAAKRQSEGDRRASEAHVFYDVDVDDDWEDSGGDDIDGSYNDLDMVLPFGKMMNWLERKPIGFGEGKMYDTSIEDKLFDEIQQSRRAQAANINKLKNNPSTPASQKKDNENKALEENEKEFRVRVSNLPKKKNIHRDLKAAFKGVSGMIDITPVVSGNKKTKDPICKGVTFVDFRSETAATRFVESFSGQSVMFGKVQKQIVCRLLNASSDKSAHEEFSDDALDALELTAPGSDKDPDEPVRLGNKLDSGGVEHVKQNLEYIAMNRFKDDLEPDYLSQSSTSSSKRPEKPASLDKKLIAEGPEVEVHIINRETESDGDDDDDIVNNVHAGKDMRKSLEAITIKNPKASDRINTRLKSAANSDPSEQLARIRALEQRLLARAKAYGSLESWEEAESPASMRKMNALDDIKARMKWPEKARAVKRNVGDKNRAKKSPRLEIPGSAKGLRIKEKAVLTGVLSKYSAKKVLNSGE